MFRKSCLASLIAAGLIAAGLAVTAAAQAPAVKAPQPARPGTYFGQSIVDLETNSGYIGVYLEEVTPEREKELGLSQERGAIVMDVVKGGPADKAGLKENDVVTSFNGTEVESVRQFQRMLRETPPGRTVHIEVTRDRKPMSFNVTLQKQDFGDVNRAIAEAYGHGQNRLFTTPRATAPAVPFEFNFGNFDADSNFFARPRLGLSAEQLTDQLAGFFGVRDGHGVLVSEVSAGSAASAAGLKAGDVIIEFDSQKINSVADLRNALAKKSEGSVAVKIVRDHSEKTVTVELKPGYRQIRFLRVPHPLVFADRSV